MRYFQIPLFRLLAFFKLPAGFSLLALYAVAISAPVSAQVNYDIDALSHAVVQVKVDDGDGSGTLMVIDGEPMVFTNRHVVQGFSEATIAVLVDVNEPAVPMFTASLVGFSEEHDFAVYRLDEDLEGNPVTAQQLRSGEFGFALPEVVIADNKKDAGEVRRGDPIGLLGYPGIGDDELVYTTGIVSSVQYGEYRGRRLPMWYRTNAEMSPGNSGGMAVNASGEFIGIPTSVRSESRTLGRLGNLLAMPFVLALLDDSESLLTSWEGYISPDAGGALDYSLEPNYGDASLTSRDISSGYRIDLVSGGTVNVAYLENSCTGYAAAAPDFRFDLSEDLPALQIVFVAEYGDDDATMIVNAPDGSWHCNDDFFDDSLDPGLTIADAASGQYDVWVGSYYEDEYLSGELFIGDEYDRDSISRSDPGSFDLAAEPYYETLSLRAGFTPDPYRVDVAAGGSVDVSRQGLNSSCIGYAAEAPDYRLVWEGSETDLYLYFEAEDGGDATLVVNSASGQWHCNDDAHADTLNPQLILSPATPGTYDIWVGTYAEEESASGELVITGVKSRVP